MTPVPAARMGVPGDVAQSTPVCMRRSLQQRMEAHAEAGGEAHVAAHRAAHQELLRVVALLVVVVDERRRACGSGRSDRSRRRW